MQESETSTDSEVDEKTQIDNKLAKITGQKFHRKKKKEIITGQELIDVVDDTGV